MTVYCCAKCRCFLTTRPPEWRDHEFIFPYSDDFRGCDVCGALLCERCAVELGPKCPDCGGGLHAGRMFNPTGEHRLPLALQRIITPEERVAWVERQWRSGQWTQRDRRGLLRIVAELARGCEGPADPAQQAKFEEAFLGCLERFAEPVVAALRTLVAAPLPGEFEVLEFDQSDSWSRFPVTVHAAYRSLGYVEGIGPPFRGKLLATSIGVLVPAGAVDEYEFEVAGVRTYESGARVFTEWFAERWNVAGGAAFPLPARMCLSPHICSSTDSQFYDLNARRWLPCVELGGP